MSKLDWYLVGERVSVWIAAILIFLYAIGVRP